MELLATILEGFLDIGKIENNSFKIQSTYFKFTPFLDNIKQIFEEKVKEKGLVFNFTTTLPENATEVKIKTDLQRLKQLYINLLFTSLKLTFDGFISVRTIVSKT